MKKKAKSTRNRSVKKSSTAPDIKKRIIILCAGFVVFCSLLAACGLVVYQQLARSDFFQITGFKIQGTRRLAKNFILELSGVDIHTNLLALDVAEVKERILGHDWIKSVDIDLHWPNQLTINIRERAPIAIINLHDGLYYLDKAGVAFAKVLPPEDMDYPVITGAGLEEWSPPIKGSPLKKALKFISYAGRGNSILPKQSISEVHLTEENDIVLFLVSRPFPIYLGKENMYTKYNRLAKVLYWLYKRKEFSETAYIRMDYMEHKVLVGKTLSG